MKEHWIEILADGTVRRHGIETPTGTRVVEHTDDTIVVKVPGHRYFVGLHMDRGYAPTAYIVYDVLFDGGGRFDATGWSGKVRERIRFPAREVAK